MAQDALYAAHADAVPLSQFSLWCTGTAVGQQLADDESHLWFEFALAIVGAAAVLSGLLFVAMSINIERIMGS